MAIIDIYSITERNEVKLCIPFFCGVSLVKVASGLKEAASVQADYDTRPDDWFVYLSL